MKFKNMIVATIFVASLTMGGLLSIHQALAADVNDAPLPFKIDATNSDPDRPIRPFSIPYIGPLVDTHSHLVPMRGNKHAFNDDVLEAIEKAHVARIVLLPPPNEAVFNDPTIKKRREQLRQDSHGRVLVMCGSDYLTQWMNRAASEGKIPDDVNTRMEQLSQDLKGGLCSGAGEIGFFHFNKTGHQNVVKLPALYPPLLAIAETTARAGAWLDMHAEPVEPNGTSHREEVFTTISAMFKRAPELRLICSHTCLTNPQNARALLTAFPNLMMNLKNFRNPPEWGHLEPITNLDGEIYTDWATLLEEMPDRFMIGMDFMFGRTEASSYPRNIKKIRKMLGSLNRETARRIAFENAERVFGVVPRLWEKGLIE